MQLWVVVKPFTEVRTGRTYQPDEVIIDPSWYEPNDRRGAARAARGQVELREVAVQLEEAPPGDQPGGDEVTDGNT